MDSLQIASLLGFEPAAGMATLVKKLFRKRDLEVPIEGGVVHLREPQLSSPTSPTFVRSRPTRLPQLATVSRKG